MLIMRMPPKDPPTRLRFAVAPCGHGELLPDDTADSDPDHVDVVVATEQDPLDAPLVCFGGSPGRRLRARRGQSRGRSTPNSSKLLL